MVRFGLLLSWVDRSNKYREGAETERMEDTSNPDWTGVKLEIAINQLRSIEGSMRVEVFDHDALGSHDSLGFIDLPWPFWMKGQEEVFSRKQVSQDLKSEEGQDKATGKIAFDLEWRPAYKKPAAAVQETAQAGAAPWKRPLGSA